MPSPQVPRSCCRGNGAAPRHLSPTPTPLSRAPPPLLLLQATLPPSCRPATRPAPRCAGAGQSQSSFVWPRRAPSVDCTRLHLASPRPAPPRPAPLCEEDRLRCRSWAGLMGWSCCLMPPATYTCSLETSTALRRLQFGGRPQDQNDPRVKRHTGGGSGGGGKNGGGHA